MDGNAYQYQPPVQAAPAPAKSRKPLLVVAGAVALVACGLAAFLLLRMGGASRPAVTGDQIQSAVSGCDASANPAGCQSVQLTSLASSTGSPEPCKALAGEARDSCVWSAAKEAGDARTCDAMEDADRKARCQDDVLLRVAVAAHDAAGCSAIKDAGYKTSCVEQIEPTSSANCASRGLDAATCQGMARSEAAVAAGKPALCDGTGERKDACLDMVGETDADGDGLTALVEAEYGSSPTNPDTDGDGFGDGAEVSGGYNPNGPGKL